MAGKKGASQHRKDYMARTFRMGKERRAARNAAQIEACRRNMELRRSGKLTPWGQACADRARRRAAERASTPTGGLS